MRGIWNINGEDARSRGSGICASERAGIGPVYGIRTGRGVRLRICGEMWRITIYHIDDLRGERAAVSMSGNSNQRKRAATRESDERSLRSTEEPGLGME